MKDKIKAEKTPLDKSFPIPKVSVSGKYEVLIEDVSEDGDVLQTIDTIWIFKDDAYTRSNRKILKIIRLLEEYKPIKACEMNDDGVVNLYSALISDAHKDISNYNNRLVRHNRNVEKYMVQWFDNMFSEDWDESFIELQNAEKEKDEYVHSCLPIYKRAEDFLNAIYNIVTGEDIPKRYIS